MGTILMACLIALALALPAAAAERKAVTFFSDGALVELEAQASRGSVTFPLPHLMIDGTLRVTPLGTARVTRVETIKHSREGKQEQELDRLQEQKSRLQDRLRALATREEIFTAAAKSQSGKAPRKTKANPDPIQSIRQGTDFAIAQLEAVYTSRRKTEQEIRRVDARIAALRPGGGGADQLARVTVQPAKARIRARYALAGPGWTPRYDLRLNGSGLAQLILYGDLPEGFDGYLLRAAFGPLTPLPAQTFAAGTAPGTRLAEYSVSAADEAVTEGIAPALSFTLTNGTALHFPAGEASLYYKGEYRGRLRFEGISSGRSKRVGLGG